MRWLGGQSLGRCDAGRYSIAIDEAGNVAPCLALSHAGNLLESSAGEILAGMDRSAIKQCSDQSSCNMLCSRVVGSFVRCPLSAALTPSSVAPHYQFENEVGEAGDARIGDTLRKDAAVRAASVGERLSE